ncbi:CbiQ family ECF transporter T component [uncultured Propionibacterium sp.]|uniref:CbiQ family ECF transporter T component n=1 Tax=uncultured Propionibacterium sp. TaxID=218066 RepID=UPI00292CCC72|nr:CbiQ family ECF transporter T component [uncultured Propionibacterium sp.]
MRLENYLGAYRAGHSPMHRVPVAVKYLLLVVVGVVPFFAGRWLVSVTASVASALVLVVGARRSPRELNPMLGVLVMNALILVYDYFFLDWRNGVIFVCGMLSCLWLARSLTCTTPASALMDAIAALARPFRSLGAKPEKLALTIAIMWNAIPGLLLSVRQVRDAARARGVERASWRFAAPVVIGAVGRALEMGEALQARGLADSD